jgi:hypothetical protein
MELFNFCKNLFVWLIGRRYEWWRSPDFADLEEKEGGSEHRIGVDIRKEFLPRISGRKK